MPTTLQTYATTTLTTLVLLTSAWLYTDYTTWLSHGTGGTPPTPAGYWRMTKLRLRLALTADNDLTKPSSLSSSGESYLPSNLPQRNGPRPKLLPRPLPQRQHPSPSHLDQVLSRRLHDLPRKYTSLRPDTLLLDKSNTEGRSTDAIYALPSRTLGATDRVLGHEIAHVHPQDGSLHVWLTQRDARMVVERGWGERFALGVLGLVDQGWVFVYAPRNEGEVEVVEGIFGAGVGHLTGWRV